ncbi:IDEAL domain-containing protein [Neobacillus mesonae]|uniref:IDEAL domain-containing protein n=1 Tax=Neobacillus mesonae TaxID=1193713 RepID=UPI002041C65A|nr:IDEAL domain-containing protein [Neobacillus mesonae]MCM3568690.1 IDEAL domain-containing protein [Neobacillus mesonae]
MEKKLLHSPQQPIEMTDSEFAEMFLKHALTQFKKEKILKEIDKTLKEGNKARFLLLTEELKKIS